MAQHYLRKYGAAATIDFELFEVDGVDFRINAVHAAGDTKIMKDEGVEANTANAFVDEGSGYSLALSSAELTAARVVIYVIDQTATKAWLDTSLVIETYGNASAQHAFDLNTATQGVNVTQWLGTAAATPTVAGVPEVDLTHIGGVAQSATDLKDFADAGYDPATNKVQGVVLVDTTTTNTDMVGTDSAALAIVATEARLAELDAANLPTDVAAVKTDTAAILTDTADMQPKLGAPAGTDMSADIAAVKVDTAAILVDTGTTLDGRIPAALVSGRMDADVGAISTSTAAADNLEASAEIIIIGAAEAGTLSTTQMTTNLTEATNEHYNGRIVIWTSGVLLGQASDITAYLGSTGRLTYTAVTEAPSAADTFVIV